jgi:hypothetical protein
MKKIKFLLFFSILLMLGITNAQQETGTCPQYSHLKRIKFRLAFDTPNSPVLKQEQLFSMFSYSQYEDYRHARRCYAASISLFSLAAYCTGFGIVTTSMSYFDTVVILYCGVPTLALLISGTTLIIHSKKRLNRIAKDYNSQYKLSYQPVKLHFGIVGNGIGMKLTF